MSQLSNKMKAYDRKLVFHSIKIQENISNLEMFMKRNNFQVHEAKIREIFDAKLDDINHIAQE